PILRFEVVKGPNQTPMKRFLMISISLPREITASGYVVIHRLPASDSLISGWTPQIWQKGNTGGLTLHIGICGVGGLGVVHRIQINQRYSTCPRENIDSLSVR
ncbi:MAG TPA: hypothetical protein VGK38_11930, partial [Prolixibacteraceae bacterium]